MTNFPKIFIFMMQLINALEAPIRCSALRTGGWPILFEGLITVSNRDIKEEWMLILYLNFYLLFHNYSRQETNILSPEGLSMSNSVVY